MKKILEYLLQKPRAVNIYVALIVVLGVMALSDMRTNFLPPEPVNFINVSVAFPGSSPLEVEEEVVNKIEENLKGLKGIDRFTSTSQESFALVSIELLEEADPNEVLLDVNNAVDKITTFPEGVENPVITKQENLSFTLTFGIVGDVGLQSLKDYAKTIKDDLLLNPGISVIEISGFPEEEIEIRLRENDLRAYNLTMDQVARAIQITNLKASGGEIKTGTRNFLIRLDNREYRGIDLLDIPITTTEKGQIVTVGDVSEIKDQFADKPGQAYLNGDKAAIVKVFSRSEEDILGNAEVVRNYLADFNQKHEVVNAEVVEDNSISLNTTINMLIGNAWQGILLVLLVLGLFLNPRIAFWVALKIPVALLGMFVLSQFFDITINQLSLFGTIVVLGIIVDDGVVVAENIYQHYSSGKNPLQAAINGTTEVIPAILSALATTAIAFSLFFYLDGQLGDYFSDLSFVVCATLVIALLESLLFLPVHIARSKALTEDNRNWRITEITNKSLLTFRDKVYSGIIAFSIKRPVVPVIGVISIMILTIFSMSSGIIQGTFFPVIDQDIVTAKIELEAGTDKSVVLKKLDLIEDAVWRVNDHYNAQREDGNEVVRYIEKVIGPNENEGFLNVYLLEGDTRGILSFDIASKIRQETGPIPEAKNLSYGGVNAFGKPVSIALIGEDLAELRQAKTKLRDYLNNQTELKDVTDTDKTGMPELYMTLKPKARFLGLSEAEVFDQIRKGFFGLEVQSLQRNNEEVKIWVRYDEEDRRSIDDLKDARLRLQDGSSFPLGELADFRFETRTMQINHQSGTREIRVEADIENLMVSVPAVLAKAQKTILTDLGNEFPNVRYTLEGEARLSSKTQNSSQGPSMIVLILIVTILMLNYRSFTKTIAILSMLPFAFVGVAWGTFFHGNPVSIFSFLGLIALWGILINNGLVLISTYNDMLLKGLEVKEAMREAAISRFRPIVLTTITTVFGLAPLLLNNSVSAQFIKPTAIAIAYGLIFGMVLTLSFLPAMVLITNKIKFLYMNKILRIKPLKPRESDIVLMEVKNELS